MKHMLLTLWIVSNASPLFAQSPPATPSTPARPPAPPVIASSPLGRGLPTPMILPVPVIVPVSRPAPVPIYRPAPASQPTIDPQVPASQAPPPASAVSLSGPRFGVSVLSDGVVRALAEKELFVSPTISQFGWQFERQFYGKQDGVTVLNEWVGLLGGLDQGVVIPSLTWLVGVRTREGAEFGLGPNVTPAGVALAISAGVTFRAGIMNIPMNFAIVPTKAGVRATLLTGFTLRH